MAFIEGKPQPNFATILGGQLKTGLGAMAQINLQQQQITQQSQMIQQQQMQQQSTSDESAIMQICAYIIKLKNEKLDLANKLELELREKQQLESKLQKMITVQNEDAHKIKMLSYSTFGLGILSALLVLAVIFKRKKTQIG